MTEPKNLKDKECPFCHQVFTSSSLGRHLDLYIRERNPKPPDDIHNVDEIKRLRSSITRRQPRHPLRRDTSTPSSSKATPLDGQLSPILSSPNTEGAGEDAEPFRTFVNQANWQATGAINEVPPTPRTNPSGWTTRDAGSCKGNVKVHATRRKEYMDAVDLGRAAELALKEVLETVKVASQRAHPPTPFEFNFFALTLPQMYLRCLSPPATLLAEPAQRPYELAWSIAPPSALQCEALRSWLSGKLADWRRYRDSAHYGVDVMHNGADGNEDLQTENEKIKLEESSYYQHLEDAFRKWSTLSDTGRQEQWHVECAKAFATEKELHQGTRRKLDYADQELQQLRGRLDQLVLNQQAPDVARYPATPLHLSREAVSHLPASNELDHNRLISKWRSRLQSARSTQHPFPGTKCNPSPQPLGANGNKSPLERHRNSWTGHTGTSNASPVAEDEDAELEDAPGEDDFDHLPMQSQQTQLDGNTHQDLRAKAISNDASKKNGLRHVPMDIG